MENIVALKVSLTCLIHLNYIITYMLFNKSLFSNIIYTLAIGQLQNFGKKRRKLT